MLIIIVLINNYNNQESININSTNYLKINKNIHTKLNYH